MKSSGHAKTLIAVDGNALLHRAWHAIPPLTDRTGRVVNAVYGFLNILFRAVREFAPAYLVVTFDRPGKTFRHDAYGEYKTTRVKQPDELYAQIPILEGILAALKVPVYAMDGYEADDTLGTIAALVERKAKDVETVILTGDMDTLQLVSPRTKVLTLRKGITDTVVYDPLAVRARFGLDPSQMIDYKALRGDPSDNVKGVPGVGEKTAAELLKEFGSVEGLYANLKKGKTGSLSPKLVSRLLAGETDARLAKTLVTIRRDLAVPFSLKDAELERVPREKVIALMGELGFRSLIERIPEAMVEERGTERGAKKEERGKRKGKRAVPATAAPWVLTDAVEAASWAKRAGGPLTFLVGAEPSVALLEGDQLIYAHGDYAVRALKPAFEDAKIAKATHDVKAAAKLLRSQGINLAGVVFDTMLADYLLAPGTRAHDLAALALEHLGEELPAAASGQGTLLGRTPAELAADAGRAIRSLARLAPLLARELDARSESRLLLEMEIPLAYVLADMERLGVRVDADFLRKMGDELERRIEKLTRLIWKDAGEEFNVASPQQLGTVLFEKLRIPSDTVHKTAGGAFSTAASELEKLRGLHPIVEKIGEYRELTKLKGTYVDALPALVDKESGRVHTSYSQVTAATGRLSSSDPNLQNIPIRTELGREIRRAFVADRGNRLVAADYSQIELRLVAAIAGVKAMIQSFKKDEDIHRRTAAQVAGIPLEQVTPDQRRAAKAVNFGIIYGMGAQGLAAGAGISFGEAKDFIAKYFEANPELREYMDRTKALAATQGYVETVFGRRRYFPEIGSGMPQVRAAAERAAINHPVQGTAADVMKLAMIAVHAELGKRFPASRLILTVHDELVVECKEKDAAAVCALLKKEMEDVYRFPVPLVVDCKVGKNWGEMKAA